MLQGHSDQSPFDSSTFIMLVSGLYWNLVNIAIIYEDRDGEVVRHDAAQLVPVLGGIPKPD
jgi:hypothetical protein